VSFRGKSWTKVVELGGEKMCWERCVCVVLFLG
jgi:hypothetical protein